MVQSQAAATARQRKRPDRAREIVAGLEEFTRGLVARFPRDAWSHLAMVGMPSVRGQERMESPRIRRAPRCNTPVPGGGPAGLRTRSSERRGAGDAHREAATRGTPAPGCVLRTARRVPLLTLVLHRAKAA